MKTTVKLISKKAKDGKLFVASVFNYGEGSNKEWRIDGSDDFTFSTKEHAVRNARIMIGNMVDNYNDEHNL